MQQTHILDEHGNSYKIHTTEVYLNSYQVGLIMLNYYL